MNKNNTLSFFFFLSLSIFANEIFADDEWVSGLCDDGQGYIEFTYGEYFGECKDEKTQHGIGTFTFYDTSEFPSHFEDDIVYEGEWDNAYMHGTGTLTWPDGSTYQGNFYKSVRHGLGYETKPDGSGSFVMYDNDNLSSKDYLCIGCSSYGDNNVRQFWTDKPQQYIGRRNGGRNGKGTYTWFFDNYQTKVTYEGDWVDNNESGKGKIIWRNGNTYEGDWVDGKRTGIGTWISGSTWTEDDGTQYQYEKGEMYTGMYKDNKRHGFGTITKPGGISIKQLYNMGEPLEFENGFCMQGNCENGKGSYINIEGQLYEGKWAKGKRNGSGTLTNILDNTSVKSLWENDLVLCDFSQVKVIGGKLACADAANSSTINNQKQIASDKKNITTTNKIDAIVFSDLHWEMSDKEMKEAMNTKSNGLCTDMGLAVSCFVNDFNTLLLLDSVNERIYFSCGVYNGCSYSPEEMSKIIGKRLGLRDWKYQLEFGGAYGQFYCAKGKAGDKICTSKTIGQDGSTKIGVYLAKGTLGSSGLDF